jgi:hypothetical protein
MRRSVLATALILATAIASAATAGSPCLRSGSGQVSVTGTLIQKVVPGPPNYKSVNEGDAPQLRWLIRLEATMCVTGTAGDTGEAPEVADVRVLQLILPDATIAKRSDLVGTRVTVSGFVSSTQTGGQNPVVFLDVKSIDAAR